MLDKALDLVCDNRNPLFLLPNYIRKIQIEKKLGNIEIPKETEVDFALTFDIEYDSGSAGNKTHTCAGPFLDRIIELLDKQKIPATFFVQGNLVEPYREQLAVLQQMGSEIGLHGWAHEPWGNAWFVKERLPSLAERELLLQKSLVEFEKCGLKRPASFRAPNMVIDKDSLTLLEKYGFEADSSAASYKGVLPVVSKMGKIMEIPVSVDPVPKFGSKFNTSYAVFGTYNLGKADKIAENIIKYQILQGRKPLLVFLAHPWEFYENEKFKYCGKETYALLSDFICKIKNTFDTEFIPLKQSRLQIPGCAST